jgi:hypothetical protein
MNEALLAFILALNIDATQTPTPTPTYTPPRNGNVVDSDVAKMITDAARNFCYGNLRSISIERDGVVFKCQETSDVQIRWR